MGTKWDCKPCGCVVKYSDPGIGAVLQIEVSA